MPGHGKCNLTRRVVASEVDGREGQGRPLGLIFAWLHRGQHLRTKADHMVLRDNLFGDRVARKEARAALKAVGGQDVADLFASERPQRDEETDSEPEVVP